MRDPTLERRALALLEQALEWAADASANPPSVIRSADQPDNSFDARLRVAAAGDPALLARVQVLLQHARGDSSLIPAEPHGMFFSLPQMPERVGPYRLTEIVGEGGMGMVCRGERDDGLFEQTVAVKLIRPGVLSPALTERFSIERRLLARLNHPNIAQLFDGGEDDSGNSYIVMEFVDGANITDYVRDLGAEPRNRLNATLALFEQACIAVQAAHQQLIVHADIKPANVLVTVGGRVKLLDFGIARMLGGNTGAQANPLAATPMTRAYAAPERRAGQQPSVASDVYALGAMLFELLTGALPDAVTKTVIGATPGAVTPGVATSHAQDTNITLMAPPGTALAAEITIPAWAAPSTACANNRALARLLRGDLDAIVLRAVAAQPSARYATVAELLNDVRAWRDNRPLPTRRDVGAGYRLQKFLRRNRLAVAAATALVAVLLGATVITQAQYRAAERARADATRRFDEARAMSKYMLFDLFDRLAPVPGTLPARLNLASTAQGYLDRLSAINNAPLDVRLETARGYVRLAAIQGGSGHENLGDVAGFRRNTVRAKTLYRSLLNDAPQRADIWQGAAELAADEAFQAMHADNRMDVAETALNEADTAVAHALQLNPHDDASTALRWTLMSYRIDLLQWLERNTEAIAVGERAIAAIPNLPAKLRSSPLFSYRTSTIYKRHAESLRYAGRARDALPFSARAVTLAREALRLNPGLMKTTVVASMAEWSYGQSLMEVSDAAGALSHFDNAIALSTQGLHKDVANVQLQRTDMINRSDRALALSALNRHADALAAFAAVLATAQARVRAEPTDQSRVRDLWEQRKILGELQSNAGERQTSCATWRRLLPELNVVRQRGELAEYDVKALLGELQSDLIKHCS